MFRRCPENPGRPDRRPGEERGEQHRCAPDRAPTGLGPDPGARRHRRLRNNCDDGTTANVAELAPALGVPLVLVEGRLRRPHAHVGLARRIAMDVALGLGAADCTFLTTDADTRIGEGWVRELTAPFALGFDLVCGDFEIDDPAPVVRGLQLHPLWRMEARYAALQNRVQHACAIQNLRIDRLINENKNIG